MRRLLFVTLLMLAGCAGKTAEKVSPTTTGPVAAAASAPRCETVPDGLLATMTSGLKGGSIRRAQAVRSNEFPSVYMVAADVEGKGHDGKGDLAVWATNKLEGAGTIYSVDAAAKDASTWGPAPNGISPTTDGVAQAKECSKAVA
jgi:hypothetical protein